MDKKKATTQTLDSSAPVEATPPTEPKAIVISYDNNDMPTFNFLGLPWTGKDIPQLQRALPRAYHFYKRSIKRKEQSDDRTN